MYGVRSNVTSVKQAISLLGKEAVRTFALTSAANSFTIDLSPYNMTKEQFALACETVMPNGEITDESIATAKDTIEEFGLDLESFENALEKVLNS